MGKTLYELAREKQQECTDAIMLAKVNGKLTEITEKNIDGDNVEFVTTKTSIGNETYKRSVVLLMLNAFNKLKDKEDYGEICVEYSISKGLYCDLKGAVKNVPEEFIASIKELMLEDVKKDIPIRKNTISTSEAVKLFGKLGMQDKTKLFNYRRSSYVNVY